MTITYKTSDYEIEKMKKDELVAAIPDKPGRLFSKHDLIELVKAERDLRKAAHEAAEAAKTAAREEELVKERADEGIKAIYTALAARLRKLAEPSAEKVKEFRTRAADPRESLVSLLSWRAEEVMFDELKVAKLYNFAEFFEKNAVEAKHLFVEVVEFSKEALARGRRDVMQDGYRHNSTGYMANLVNMIEFKVKQYETNLYEKILAVLTSKEAAQNAAWMDDYIW